MDPMISTFDSLVTDQIEREATTGAAENVDSSSKNRNYGDTTVREFDLCYYPFPRQNDFHGSEARYRLFGGAAGPGKSKALLMEGVYQAHLLPNVNTLLLRRTFSELEQTL